MKAAALILVFAFCSIECRKIVPINKHANIDFINMESGGMRQPAVQPQPQPQKPAGPVPLPAPVAPAPTTKAPAAAPAAKPVSPPSPQPMQPVPRPAQVKPVPVYPAPVANPITTPGPGSVKALVNFYDSQGKASPIRPYSYSQAVKQG